MATDLLLGHQPPPSPLPKNRAATAAADYNIGIGTITTTMKGGDDGGIDDNQIIPGLLDIVYQEPTNQSS